MTVLIPDGASITVEGEVVSEAWIGVTNSNGDVVGSVYWTNSVTSIAVFGQDGDIPGMATGETFNFIVSQVRETLQAMLLLVLMVHIL